MIGYDPIYKTEQLLAERRRRLTQEAADYRRARSMGQARPERARFQRRVFWRVGDWMIALGTWLKERNTPLDYETHWRQANGKA